MSKTPAIPILVEVAYALPDRQALLAIQVPAGTTALQAVLQSNIASQFEGLDPRTSKLGVFGKLVSSDYVLQSGDRVEIYRPLLADPKEVRRQLAEQGKSMGQRPDGGLKLNPRQLDTD